MSYKVEQPWKHRASLAHDDAVSSHVLQGASGHGGKYFVHVPSMYIWYESD